MPKGDEELRAVCVGTSIRHAEKAIMSVSAQLHEGLREMVTLQRPADA